MNAKELAAARLLLLLLHEQADRNPRLRPRLAAFRTALACVELVQAASEPEQPVRVSRSLKAKALPATVVGDFSPTGLYARDFPRTELSTQRVPL